VAAVIIVVTILLTEITMKKVWKNVDGRRTGSK